MVRRRFALAHFFVCYTPRNSPALSNRNEIDISKKTTELPIVSLGKRPRA